MILWWSLLVGSILLFLVVEILILPKYLLESKYTVGQTSDRGIRKYKTFDEGMYLVYEPNLLVRKWIKQYVIGHRNGEKMLKCKVDEGVDYVEYDVVLFDAADKVFRVLGVQQLLDGGVFTDEIELPPETAYVTLVLRRVNNRDFPKVACARVSRAKLTAYGLLTCIMAMATAFCMNLSFSYLFGEVFRESYAASLWENVLVLGVALIASVLGVLMLSLLLFLKNKKK
jgi:hypothetical protein